jgi:acyl-CoA synthetase (AMP-forming)/AMP-acid ligase II/fatty-acid desaturase
VIRSSVYAGEAQFTTLRDLVVRRAQAQPDLSVFQFVDGNELDDAAAAGNSDRESDAGLLGRTLTCRELETEARRIAAWLATTTSPGDRVLVLVAPGLEFIAAFFGCVSSGRIAVPVYPPAGMRQQRSHDRLAGILRSAGAIAAVAGGAYVPMLTSLFRRQTHGQLPAILNLDALGREGDDERCGDFDWSRVEIAPHSPAMLQYTSGSTAEPRGVVLSHANLLHNSEHIRRRFEHTPASRGVSCLPPYHDMGLIGGILQPLYAGFPVTLLSPMDFIQQPLRWLTAVSRFATSTCDGVTSGGPNFAYDLVVERTTPEERAKLDLSNWKVAFVGAEPIRAETLRRFAEVFEPAGFDPAAFYPCYGLAESTLIVSGGVRGKGYTTAQAARDPAVDGGESSVAGAGSVAPKAAAEHVGSGRALDDQDTLVVDPETGRRCRENETGEIWVRGPSIASGYWNDPEATAATFQAALDGDPHGRFLRTGDLGYVQNSELFVTGRIKDLIILAGVNYYPQDLEQTAATAQAAIGRAAAFSVDGPEGERLVIVAEVARSVEREGDAAQAEIVAAVREAITREHRLRVHEVVPVRTASIPTTLSGKVQRRLCRTQYLARTLKRVETSRAQAGSAHRGVGSNDAGSRGERAVSAAVDPNSAARRMARRLAWVMVVTPLVGLAAAIWLSWGRGVGLTELGLLAGMYVATVLGVEVGLHRHFSHRAFKAHGAVRAALAILGSMAAQGPVLFWVSIHRRHHAHSDRPGDPHSPYYDGAGKPLGRSLLHAHMGWLFETDGADLASYAPDVLRDRLAFALHRTYPLWVAAGLALPAAIGGAISGTWMGALGGFLWGGLVRVLLVHHATWAVNSLCHVHGHRAHATRDHSTNNVWLILPSLGGSWHNNHHAYPSAAINTTRWWQADPSGWTISLLGRLGLAWDIRRVQTGDALRDPSNIAADDGADANESPRSFGSTAAGHSPTNSAATTTPRGTAAPTGTQTFRDTVALGHPNSETVRPDRKTISSPGDAEPATTDDTTSVA